jgi:hypothetical protein
VNDDETPEVVVDDMALLAEHINSASPAWFFLTRAFRGTLRDLNEKPTEKFIEFQRILDDMRPEMRKFATDAIVSFILATSYKSLFIGSILRRVIFYSVNRDQQGAEIAVDAYAKRHSALPDGNPA